MKLLKNGIMLTAMLLIALTSANAQENAEEIMKKSHMAMYYGADDGSAVVEMTIVNSRGKERIREFTMLRLDLEDGGKQKYYTYFKKPQDVARLTFMVHKLPNESDNRWLYVPAVDLVKRISADDKASSFVGSDFTYEDVSGRHWTEDNHTLKGEETLNGNAVYVIESIPKNEGESFSRKVSYIDKNNFLPLKEEYYNDKDVLERVYTAEKVEVVDGIATPVLRKMTNVKKNQYTTVQFNEIKYNVNIKDEIFTERYLKNPPREFIR